MSGFRTPTSKKYKSRVENNPEFQTPIKIPASPFLEKIGYGCGVQVFSLERSPKVGFARSPWAIKKPNRAIGGEKYNERIRFEAEVLRKLSHPNIVGFRGFTEISNGDPCLAMEKLDSSLGDKIEKRLEEDDDPFPAKHILKIMYEIFKGLEYLHHTAHILHGDIKSYNVLVSEDYEIVKLCDFGVSLPLTDSLEMDISNKSFNYVGTECWSAPEIIFDDGPVTNKADIWASGLVIWEMLALSPPHVKNSDADEDSFDDSMNENVTNNKQDASMDEGSDFLSKLYNENCGTRPPLPAINLGKEYEKVLEIFFMCTTADYKHRPSAKALVRYFNFYVYNK